MTAIQIPINRIIFTILITAFFIISGIFNIYFSEELSVNITKEKQLLFFSAIIGMGYYTDLRSAANTYFGLGCAIIIALYGLNLILRFEYVNQYLHRIIQITFIFIFVSFLVQRRMGEKPFLDLLNYYSPILFASICLFVVLFAANPVLAHAISNGFGNGRVSFSIWLAQFAFLAFILKQNTRKKFQLLPYLFAAPIIVLQTFSGARTGLLASIAIWVFFSYRTQGIKFIVPSGAVLALLIVTAAYISPIQEYATGTSILRHLQPDLENESFYTWIDRLSSFRLEILMSAVSSLDLLDLIIGKGLNNFQGLTMTEIPHQVHNIYVRALGEFGFLGLSAFIFLLSLPLRVASTDIDIVAVKFYYWVFLAIGLLHPDLLVTAISTCIVFWICYAEIYQNDKSITYCQAQSPRGHGPS